MPIFFCGFLNFFCGQLPPTPGFRLAKQIPNFHYTTWVRILSDRNIFCTLGGGGITAGSYAPGAFLVVLGEIERPTKENTRAMLKFSLVSGYFLVKLSTMWSFNNNKTPFVDCDSGKH